MSMQTINTASEYDAMLAATTIPPSETVGGIERHARFETLDSSQIETLNEYCRENVRVARLVVSSPDMALHILGGAEVNPTEPYNYVRGSGKTKQYYYCSANQHNRIVKPSNLGDLTKEGLVHDLIGGYWGLGPVAHIDCYGWILSLQHRLFAYIAAYDASGGEVAPLEVLTLFGIPPQLAATLDRGAPKTVVDQEFIDRGQFDREFVADVISDITGESYLPENYEKYRNLLSGILVTSRHNIYSRFRGTGYHPSKRQQPSVRQALALQADFTPLERGDELQKLVVAVQLASITEEGKPSLWVGASPLTPPMVVTAIVLASNVDATDRWEPGSPIRVNWEVADMVLRSLKLCSEAGDEGFSSLRRELAKAKAEPKKPTGFDRFVFWALVSAIDSLLKGEYDPTQKYYPTVNATLIKRLKDGKASYPLFGGYDDGPDEKEDNE